MSLNRAAVKRRIRDIAAHVLTGVEVSYEWVAEPSDSMLYLGAISGAVDVESLGTDPLTRDDFTIGGSLIVMGHTSAEDAEDAAEAILATLAATLKASRRLTAVPGLDDGDTASYAGVISARVSEYDGPIALASSPAFGDAVAGAIDFTISCSSNP